MTVQEYGMPAPEAPAAEEFQGAQEPTRFQQLRHALGNFATALIVADKGEIRSEIARNLASIKPF